MTTNIDKRSYASRDSSGSSVVATLMLTLCLLSAQTARAASVVPTVNDSIVANVTFEGNQALSKAVIQKAIHLKPGAALSRAAVASDVARIEAAYRQAGMKVQVWTDLTHPGEWDRDPRTTMTYRIVEGATPRAYNDADDPLRHYYDNTLVCAAAKTGEDLCHLWLNRDGSFVNFGTGTANSGHYTVSPLRADGKVSVCQYWDTPNVVMPDELSPQSGDTSAGVTICKKHNSRTTCMRGLDPNMLSDEDKKLIPASRNIGVRFYNGMCYPLGPHDAGDIWFEQDDPFPGQLGMDKVMLLPGRQ